FVAPIPGTTTLVRGNTKAILATLRLRAAGEGFRPYVLGGVGVQTTTMDIIMTAPPHFIWGAGFGDEIAAVQGSASGMIGVVRAGIERRFLDGGTLGLELGWVGIPAQNYVRTAIGKAILPSDVTSRGDGISLA